jgi:hypothetical protein
VIPDRLRALARRTVAYNRQPRRLVLLPFQAIALALAAYALWTGDPSRTLALVMVGLVAFGMVFEGVWWFVEYVVAEYRAWAPRAK